MSIDINGVEYVTYATSDIYFAAYLGALDIPLELAEPKEDRGSGHKKMIFHFKVPSKDIQRLKSSFFGGAGTVKVQKFVQQLRSLKSMCYVVFLLSLGVTSLLL